MEYPVRCRLSEEVGSYINKQAIESRVSRNQFLDAFIKTALEEHGIQVEVEGAKQTDQEYPLSASEQRCDDVIGVLQASNEAMTLDHIGKIMGVSIHTIRPVLNRLEAEGEIESAAVRSGGGRPPKYYRIKGSQTVALGAAPIHDKWSEKILLQLKDGGPQTVIDLCKQTSGSYSTIKKALKRLLAKRQITENFAPKIPGKIGSGPLIYTLRPAGEKETV